MYRFTTWGGQAERRTNKRTKQSDHRGLRLPPEPSPLIIQLTLQASLQTPLQVGMHGNTPIPCVTTAAAECIRLLFVVVKASATGFVFSA